MFDWLNHKAEPKLSDIAKSEQTLSEAELRHLMENLPLHNTRTPVEMGWKVTSIDELKKKIMHLPFEDGHTPAELGWELAHLGGKQTVDKDGSVWTELSGFRDPRDPRTYSDVATELPATPPSANPQEHPLWDEIDERGATIPFRLPKKPPMWQVKPGLHIDEHSQLWEDMEPINDQTNFKVFNGPRHVNYSQGV